MFTLHTHIHKRHTMTLTSAPPSLNHDHHKTTTKKRNLNKNIKHTYTKHGHSMHNNKKATTATLTSFLRSSFKSFPVQLSPLHSSHDFLLLNYTPNPIPAPTLKLMNKVHLNRKMVGIVKSNGHKIADWSKTNSSFHHVIEGKSYLLKDSTTNQPILLHL